jgi:N-acetylglucosamine-6-phosphate deacetylase
MHRERPAPQQLLVPLLPLIMLVACSLVFAGERTAPPSGIRENTPDFHALTHARAVLTPGQVVENATIVIRDGIITAVGAGLPVPQGAEEWDMSGKTVYAGFIDAYGEVGSSSQSGRGPGGGEGGRQGRGGDAGPGTPAPQGATYWNPNVVPQVRADMLYKPDSSANVSYRSQGITVRLVAPSQGNVKGTSALVTTGDGDGSATILKDHVALHLSITSRGNWNDDTYPGSPMGAVALVRQSFYDAQWYHQAWDAYNKDRTLPRPERNDALEAMQGYQGGTTPVEIDASDELYDLRTDKIAREFNLNLIVRGSGEEYRRLTEIAAMHRPIIVPLKFPEAPNVKTPEAAGGVSLETLMQWDIAPENAGRLAAAGVKIAFTSQGLKDTKDFLGAVRKAVARGLDHDAALRALTVTPAEMYGVTDRLGSIAVGKAADLVVCDGDLFIDKTNLLETWVDGRRYAVKIPPLADLRGEWRLGFSEGQGPTDTVTLVLKGDPDKLSGSIKKNAAEAKLSEAGLNDARLGVSFKGDSLGWKGVVRLSATKSGGVLVGDGVWSDGKQFSWHGALSKPFTAEADTSKPKPVKMASFPVNYPMGAFGTAGPPPQPAAVLFQHATVWTSGPQGKLTDASVLIQGGKIAAVGTNLTAPAGAEVVDASGKQISPGIIDCHSHSATDGGINEGTQSVTAEVRIADFVDPDDISIYRQLAGGVTIANVLHGSANPIGGQNCVMKWRWGCSPDSMIFRAAPQGVKFALGENVKQSNWGDRYTTRYPQSRMGVEQIDRDEFAAAKRYKERWAAWNKSKKGIPPRRDLELDAMAEVLDGTRLIHCHSYRQDEILALMRTCEDYGVHMATLQHILEGYKVADLMAKDKIGGSCFSDWWAYKIEVWDAIPYDGALMHNAGVVVSFNSDSDELARRLNTEAAKAMKYGGLSDVEALKFVTINPAIQLHIDSHVGSLEVGKDADLAVWSGSPLSDLSICEQTWIDGRKYFDVNEDKKKRDEMQTMRATLIQKILDSGDEPKEGEGGGRHRWPRVDIYDNHDFSLDGGE